MRLLVENCVNRVLMVARVKYVMSFPLLRSIAVDGTHILISVSSSREPVFRRCPLSGRIDQDKTWAQRVSTRDLFYLLLAKTRNFRVLPLTCNVKPGAGSVQTMQFPWYGFNRGLACDPFISPARLTKRSAGLCRRGTYTKG